MARYSPTSVSLRWWVILVGVVLGNLGLIGFHHLDAVRELASITLRD